MILEYLKKAGEYIYGNRVLMIICTLVVFIITANLLKFISNINDEHFDNHGNNNGKNNGNNNANNASKRNNLQGFMAAQIANMNNNNNKNNQN